MDVAGRVALRFTGDVVRGGSHDNLTAVRADGEHLWVAGDETATIDRLVLDSATAPTRAGRQRSFRLADLVQLPGPPEGETDLQGVARSGGWLWAIGSHALVRRRPKPIHDDAKVIRRLGKLRRDPNRFIIVRLAVQLGVDRHPEPVRVARDGRRSRAGRRPACGDPGRPAAHRHAPRAVPRHPGAGQRLRRRRSRGRRRPALRRPARPGAARLGRGAGGAPRAGSDGPGPPRAGDLPGGRALPEARAGPGRARGPRPVPGRRRPAGAGGPDDGAVGAGAGAPVVGRGRRRRWAGGARRRAAGRDGGAQRGGRRPRLGDLAARPGPARPGRAAAGGLRRSGGEPQAVAGHRAGRPGADRAASGRRRRWSPATTGRRPAPPARTRHRGPGRQPGRARRPVRRGHRRRAAAAAVARRAARRRATPTTSRAPAPRSTSRTGSQTVDRRRGHRPVPGPGPHVRRLYRCAPAVRSRRTSRRRRRTPPLGPGRAPSVADDPRRTPCPAR